MAIIEPGVLNQELQDAIRPKGFFWPPDPSSAPYCSVGGNLATCAAGPHAVKYGVARDHVLGLKAVTGKGELIKTVPESQIVETLIEEAMRLAEQMEAVEGAEPQVTVS